MGPKAQLSETAILEELSQLKSNDWRSTLAGKNEGDQEVATEGLNIIPQYT